MLKPKNENITRHQFQHQRNSSSSSSSRSSSDSCREELNHSRKSPSTINYDETKITEEDVYAINTENNDQPDSDDKQKNDVGKTTDQPPTTTDNQKVTTNVVPDSPLLRKVSTAGSRRVYSTTDSALLKGAIPSQKWLRRHKIYRTPATPPPDELRIKEKSFILDCKATDCIAKDYSRANPKLGPVIPPYNGQRDSHALPYFDFWGVERTLRRTGQFPQGDSIDGRAIDRFYIRGAGHQYLIRRNENGSGRSLEQLAGHGEFMQGVRPIFSFNGEFGFRRNTPWLRNIPSTFGVATDTPIWSKTCKSRLLSSI